MKCCCYCRMLLCYGGEVFIYFRFVHRRAVRVVYIKVYTHIYYYYTTLKSTLYIYIKDNLTPKSIPYSLHNIYIAPRVSFL